MPSLLVIETEWSATYFDEVAFSKCLSILVMLMAHRTILSISPQQWIPV